MIVKVVTAIVVTVMKVARNKKFETADTCIFHGIKNSLEGILVFNNSIFPIMFDIDSATKRSAMFTSRQHTKDHQYYHQPRLVSRIASSVF